MKKLIAGIVAASVVVLGLAACSGDSGTSPSRSGKVSGEITYALWDANYKPTLDKMVTAFNKEYPDVKVTPIVVPYGQYWTTLQTEGSSNTLPDVFWMNTPNFQLYAGHDQLAPIDGLVKSGAIDTSKYPANLTGSFRLDGKLYAVPKDVDTNAMWINKKLFTEAGVPLPQKNWTYDDFRATSKAIRDALGSQGVYGTAFYPGGQPTYYSSVMAYGGSVVGKDGKGGWEKPGSVKGLQIWADLVADGSSPTVQQLSETTGDQWFLNGKAAMFPFICGASVALIGSAPNAADYEAVPLPQGTRKATVANSLANVVSARSPHLAAAQAFQAFLAGKQAQEIQSESGVTLSAYEGTGEAFVKSHPTLGLQAFVDAVGYSVPFPVTPNGFWMSSEPTIFATMLAGAITAKEAGKQMDDALAKATAAG